ncbi:GDSL esterase/lipase At3g09930-like [Aegilops tauschii subsp. strangulata]|uniref:GDSL esterase/lipase n=2 Tax=Aegilops tauschii TaxID=37682 RepID=A0A453T955_AEGTS|nr:GDSL esterase/lipase At3g09930-like [Aegilops tauschii subsp. strangulata]
MKLMPTVFCLLLVVLALDAARVEARGTPSADQGSKNEWSSMFVFGDGFVDNGNLPKTDTWRQWSYPYGSYLNSRGSATPVPTGRLSNYWIQSDFIARILGLSEAPPSYRLTPHLSCDPSGMTFAFGGAGVYEVPDKKVPTLATQVNAFTRLLNAGVISKQQLQSSVALVSISGSDYMTGANVENAFLSSFDDIDSYIGNVTTEIAKNVGKLQRLGVRKVLVNNMHPIGCTPLRTSSNNYTTCDLLANYAATVHNMNIEHLMGNKNNAHILDLYTAFTDIVNHAPGEGSERSNNFKRKLTPCCEASTELGYCGQVSPSGERLYDLCKNPDKKFYWDETYPTTAGWEAVTEALEEPLREFLDRDYVP